MTKSQIVSEQLRQTGSSFRYWGRSEAKELPRLLFPDETIVHALNGRYEKGFALFCATNQRLLLLDKKPLVLCFEDMRYEMISEVDYTEQLFAASMSLRTPGRNLRFSSFRVGRLRNLTSYIQEQVTYVRHHQEENAFQKQQQHYEQLMKTARQQAQAEQYQQRETGVAPPPQNPPDPYRFMSMRARHQVPRFTSPPPAEPDKT